MESEQPPHAQDTPSQEPDGELLSAQIARELPAREALSLLGIFLPAPIDAATLAEVITELVTDPVKGIGVDRVAALASAELPMGEATEDDETDRPPLTDDELAQQRAEEHPTRLTGGR
jgi:hypothetical protein